MPNIAYVFGIFMFLCFRDIFSNLPVFSHAFSCNIGKSVGNFSLRTNGVLGFRYPKQLCLCVIELHMGVNIQRHADVRMAHDILQRLGIHPGFGHIRAESVPAFLPG